MSGSTVVGALGGQQKSVAIGGRHRHRLGADGARGTAAVVDHEGMAEGLAQPVGPGPADDVGGAARGIRQDQLHRFVRPGALGTRAEPAEDRGGRERCDQHGAALHHIEFSLFECLRLAGEMPGGLLAPSWSVLVRWARITAGFTAG